MKCDTTMGNGGLSMGCVNHNNSPERSRGNAARFFWDLYDSTANGSNDLYNISNESVISIASLWDDFEIGEDNRENDEEFPPNHDDGCDDGRNWWDFCYYDGSDEYWYYLGDNCLDAQTQPIF